MQAHEDGYYWARNPGDGTTFVVLREGACWYCAGVAEPINQTFDAAAQVICPAKSPDHARRTRELSELGPARGGSAMPTQQGKHTPGPWCIETPMGAHEAWIVESGKQAYEWHSIAIIPIDPEDEHDLPKKEALANARLIAAAPEMKCEIERLRAALDTRQDECLAARRPP